MTTAATHDHATAPTAIPELGNPTFTEAWALIESAKRLAAPLESGPLDHPENREILRDALRLNRRLWTIFQSELNLQDNPEMPGPMLDSILQLCDFVETRTEDAIADPTPEKVAGLIDVNRIVAEGLLAPSEDALAS